MEGVVIITSKHGLMVVGGTVDSNVITKGNVSTTTSSGGFSHGSKGSMEPPFLSDNLSVK